MTTWTKELSPQPKVAWPEIIKLNKYICTSEWPQLYFLIWPELKAEDQKIFVLWPNTKAQAECYSFKLKNKKSFRTKLWLNTSIFVDHTCTYFFMLSSNWLWNFLNGGSKKIRFVANAQRFDSLVFILVNSLQSLSRSELTGQKTGKFYHCAYGINLMTKWKKWAWFK